MTQMLHVRNWAKFQHYKDRNPPWIKLHVEMLQSADWVTLDDASKLLAVVCMIIAARENGTLPNNPDYIRRVAYLSKRPNLTPLIECGFLEIAQADASERKPTLASARPEKEQRKSRVEKEESSAETPQAASRAKASRIADDWFPSEVDRQFAIDLGFVPAQIAIETDKFIDYWKAKSGKDATKLDWSATWRNWCRKALEIGPKSFQRQDGDRVAAAKAEFARAFEDAA